MGSTVEFNNLVTVTTVNCHKLRIVADVLNVGCSWVQLPSFTSSLLLRLGTVVD